VLLSVWENYIAFLGEGLLLGWLEQQALLQTDEVS